MYTQISAGQNVFKVNVQNNWVVITEWKLKNIYVWYYERFIMK